MLRDRSLANAAFVAWYASPFRIILVIERDAEITSPAALGSAVHKDKAPESRQAAQSGCRDKGPPKENPAMGECGGPGPVCEASVIRGRRGNARFQKNEGVADPICPTTPWITGRARGGGKWATGCFPNASSAHWFLRLVDRKKAPTEPGLLEGRGSRRC
jgi:hypothetical protein